MKKFWSSLAAAGLCLMARAQDDAAPPEAPAAEPAAAAEADPGNPVIEGFGQAIPTPYPLDRYAATWSKNPFLIEVAPTAGPTVSFAQDWALTGLTVRPTGEATAYIRNKQTQEFKRVGNTEDKDGFKLVKANPNPDRKLASVEVAKGSETATLTYDETLSAPAPAQPRVPMPGQQPQGAATQPGQMTRPPIPTPGGQQTANGGRRVLTPPTAGQPPVAAPPGTTPSPNAVPPNTPVPNIPRNPSSRRRILIPQPLPQDGTQPPAPSPVP